MSQTPVLIAGGGIAGLTMALTLHQIGVPCQVFETSDKMRPLGVGINLQPNAVRELLDLGITCDELDAIGRPLEEWALVGLNGRDIYAEPRGRAAGYRWPQYAVHRGELLLLLFRKVQERLGANSVHLGRRAIGFQHCSDGVALTFADKSLHRGSLLIGADGIHSTIRSQIYPEQAPIHWGGALMWRGTVRAPAPRNGHSFIGLGSRTRRLVLYPISQPDTDGLSLMNWIAEVSHDGAQSWPGDRWFRQVPISDFIDLFDDFRFGWLDLPDLLSHATAAYENPMIDRDPIASWIDGPVALMGDAAHPMFPTGSNGASQAIVDARVIGAQILTHGVTPAALAAYDAHLCKPISELVLRNRSDGPFGLLGIIDQRCGGVFDDIELVMPKAERSEFMSGYRRAAGLAIEALNNAPSTIAAGARV